MEEYLEGYLRKVSIGAWILKLIPIPIGIITAKLSAAITQSASEGNSKIVFQQSVLLVGIILGIKLFNVVTESMHRKAISQVLHKSKQALYTHILSNPLHVLYSAEYGKVMQNINDDWCYTNYPTNDCKEVYASKLHTV